MTHALFFHSAADSAQVTALLVGMDGRQVVGVRGPAPAGVRFGGRVVVIWSAHAAADYAAVSAPALPRDAVVIQLDDTPLPHFLSGVRAKVRLQNDEGDAGRVRHAVTFGPAATAAPVRPTASARRALPLRTLSETPRSDGALAPLRATLPAPRPAVVPRRRQAHSASVVATAGAMGTLAAVAIGAVFPADTIITPSFAANPVSAPSDAFVRHEHLAETRGMTAPAAFDAVAGVTGVAVTFSAAEMQALTQTLAQSDHTLSAARSWSDQAIARLDGISARAPDAMPAMASVPRGQVAAAPTSGTTLAQAPQDDLGLRDRFVEISAPVAQTAPQAAPQISPMAYAVDQMGEVALIAGAVGG